MTNENAGFFCPEGLRISRQQQQSIKSGTEPSWVWGPGQMPRLCNHEASSASEVLWPIKEQRPAWNTDPSTEYEHPRMLILILLDQLPVLDHNWDFWIRCPVTSVSLKGYWLLSYYLWMAKKKKKKIGSNNFPCPFPLFNLKGKEQSGRGEGRGEKQRVCILIANQGNGCTGRGQILQQAESEQVRVSPSHGHQHAKLKLSWVMC